MASSTRPSLRDQIDALLETLIYHQSNLPSPAREEFEEQFRTTLAKVQELDAALRAHPPSPEILASPAMLDLQTQLEGEMAALPPMPPQPRLGTFKVVIVGEAGVGKTTWLARLRTQRFEPKYIGTLGSQVMKMCFSKPAGRVVLKLWDMAGQEKLSGLGEGYYVGADAAIVVWETGFTLSYEKCLPYIEGIKRMCGNIPIILVQTKVDLTAPPIQSQCPALKAYPSFAISTKLNQGIRDPLEYVADMLVCPKDDL